MISSHLKISMISLISSLSLKLCLNSLVYHRNIFGSSSKVFGSLRKFSENVQVRSSDLRNNFGKFSEIFGKWSEIFGKSSVNLVTRAISHSFVALTREILGTFRLDYEYEIEYENDFSRPVFRFLIITAHTHFIP